MGLLREVMGPISQIFRPPYRPAPYQSVYAGDPDAARLERPLQTRSIQRFYQADIEDALVGADAGDLTLVAQLARALRRDGVLGGILSTRTGGLARLPKLFRGTDAAVKAFENSPDGEIGLFDKIFSPTELSLFAGDHIVTGVGFGELVPMPDRPEPVFVRLDPEFLRYTWGDNRWYYRSTGGLIHVQPGDGRWVLHLKSHQNPWQHALWPALSRSYVAKDHAFHFREAFSAALANPARVASAPIAANEEQRQGVIAELLRWGVNTALALPVGWTVSLLESNGIGHKVFQETMDSSDHEFMIALAGQVVTITGGAGFANADIHATIRSDLIQDDGDGLASCLNTQALRPTVNKLFGSGERVAVAWDTKPPGNLLADANSVTAAMEAVAAANQQLAPYGLQVNAREIATRYRIPVIETTPRALAPAAPVANDISGKPPALSLVKEAA